MTELKNTSFPAVLEGRIGDSLVQTVNARDLHAYLGANKDFSDWIKYQIETFGFVENSDYVVTHENGEQYYQGVTLRRDYFLTIDMAKELAMVSRCAKGKQVRQYFIECERQAKAAAFDPAVALNDPAWLRNTLTVYTEKVIALEAANKEMSADVAALDRIAKADGSLNVTEAAKALQIRPKALFSYLSAHNWIYRRPGADRWLGYQARVQSGDLEHKVTTVLRADGSEKVTEQVRVTPQGLAKLAKLLPPAVQAAGPVQERAA